MKLHLIACPSLKSPSPPAKLRQPPHIWGHSTPRLLSRASPCSKVNRLQHRCDCPEMRVRPSDVGLDLLVPRRSDAGAKVRGLSLCGAAKQGGRLERFLEQNNAWAWKTAPDDVGGIRVGEKAAVGAVQQAGLGVASRRGQGPGRPCLVPMSCRRCSVDWESFEGRRGDVGMLTRLVFRLSKKGSGLGVHLLASPLCWPRETFFTNPSARNRFLSRECSHPHGRPGSHVF